MTNINKAINKQIIMENFADNVAKLCIEKYNSLKKTGKPNIHEWTVLSGVILKNTDESLSLVALATGTKCLGESELINITLSERGSRLSDSHAEILARRAFIRYLYDQIDITMNGCKSAVFSQNNKQIKLNNGISFHFFSSQTPCGDCSIFPKKEIHDNILPPKIRRLTEDIDEKIITESCYNDIYRTGAKCVKEEDLQDSHLSGLNYHVVGPLRTKPGRGDPTSSLSCSDKMAKWLNLGLQGSLLSLLLPPIKLESITIGGSVAFSLNAMERGLYKRFNNDVEKLKIFQARIAFIHNKSEERLHPCPTSIIWCAVRNNALEVAVAGRKQGVTKKNKKACSLLICRQMFLQTFLQILDTHQNDYREIRHPKKITYYDWKQWSTVYQNKWKQLKRDSFYNWPSKAVHLRNFAL